MFSVLVLDSGGRETVFSVLVFETEGGMTVSSIRFFLCSSSTTSQANFLSRLLHVGSG